jgi:hypothetical protein
MERIRITMILLEMMTMKSATLSQIPAKSGLRQREE